MARALPIACSLSGEDQAERLGELASLSSRVLGAESTGEGGSLVRFRPDGDTESQLKRIVAAERECCPFLDLSLAEDGSNLTLSIDGPEGAEPMIAEMVGALTGA
jgi:MerR family transcriptional regulator, copper efflux regulator